MFENSTRTFINVASASEQRTVNTTSHASGLQQPEENGRVHNSSPSIGRSKLEREREKVQRQRQKKQGQQMMPLQCNEDRPRSGRHSARTTRPRSTERDNRSAPKTDISMAGYSGGRRASCFPSVDNAKNMPASRSVYELPNLNEGVNVLTIGGPRGESRDFESDEDTEDDGYLHATGHGKMAPSRSVERLSAAERSPTGRDKRQRPGAATTGNAAGSDPITDKEASRVHGALAKAARTKPETETDPESGSPCCDTYDMFCITDGSSNFSNAFKGSPSNRSPRLQSSQVLGTTASQVRATDSAHSRGSDSSQPGGKTTHKAMYAGDSSESDEQDEQVRPISSSTSSPARSRAKPTMRTPKRLAGDVSDEDETELDSVDLPADEASAEMPNIDPENLEEFVFKPVPQNTMFRCRISRDKKGVDRGMFPTYFLHLERDDTRGVFLLAGRKRRKSSTSNYLISCDPTDLTREGTSFVGKLRSNFIGTQFTVYDNGAKPKKTANEIRRELAAVVYEPNVLGLRGPRKMTVIAPGMTKDHVAVEHKPKSENDSLLERYKRRQMESLIILRNKTPVWNAETQSYVLNFHGRVKQASVKNFQIVHESNEEYIVMQFGRVNNDLFHMDFAYPLCPVQAFGIALSSFDGKLACE